MVAQSLAITGMYAFGLAEPAAACGKADGLDTMRPFIALSCSGLASNHAHRFAAPLLSRSLGPGPDSASCVELLTCDEKYGLKFSLSSDPLCPAVSDFPLAIQAELVLLDRRVATGKIVNWQRRGLCRHRRNRVGLGQSCLEHRFRSEGTAWWFFVPHHFDRRMGDAIVDQ